ncbi:MAG: hypothetical protein ACLRSW_06100 [Christensenellaceae bacterium]
MSVTDLALCARTKAEISRSLTACTAEGAACSTAIFLSAAEVLPSGNVDGRRADAERERHDNTNVNPFL